jgi:hypothetical protein
MNLPNNIYSGAWKEGHVQGIAVDTQRGFVYYSFTTILLKTDLEGNPLATVENLIGHLGCIAFDAERNRLYGSLELKHDVIGMGIMERTGKTLSEEDAFYLVSFDLEKLDRMGMDAEKDQIVSAVYIRDVVEDYGGIDPHSGKPGRYGCGGLDGVSVGPVFGSDKNSPKKMMLAQGIRKDAERTDNDHQILLQYDPDIFEQYGQPLDQMRPHHCGPEKAEARYFFYTGNTNWGIQNLEYDPATGYWFVAVYPGIKPEFENFRMFAIDGNVAAKVAPLEGRGDEKGLLLTSAKIGVGQKEDRIYGSHFEWGSTGIAALGDGRFCISQIDPHQEKTMHSTNVKLYRFDPTDSEWFVLD